MDHTSRAKEILSKITYVTIATSSKEAKPRSTPVHAAFDEFYNVYWTSLVDTQHSKDIRENPRVFISLYDEAISQGDGVYIRANATELTDPVEIERAMVMIYERKKKPVKDVKEFTGTSLRRMYKAIALQFWVSLNEEVKKDPANSKKEISLQ